MPTYDYVGKACGHALEVVQSMSESPKRKCPSCGKSKLERLIGAGAGFLFKGSGFYLTDYRSKSYADGKSAAESAPAPESTPASTTTGVGSDKRSGESKSGESKSGESKSPKKDAAPSKSTPAAGPKKKPSRDS